MHGISQVGAGDSVLLRKRMWLSEEGWKLVARRFTVGPQIPLGWPKPDLFSVCTSPEFVEEGLRQQLVNVVLQSMKQRNKSA
jgi:hypothetical protein